MATVAPTVQQAIFEVLKRSGTLVERNGEIGVRTQYLGGTKGARGVRIERWRCSSLASRNPKGSPSKYAFDSIQFKPECDK